MGVFSKYQRFREAGQQANVNNVARYGEPARSLFTSTKVFTLHHRITITDENENVVYTAQTKFPSLHDRTDLYDADGKHSRTERGAVNDQLRIEQDRAHHERSQPVFPHPLPRKGCRNGNRPVHTERGGNPEETGRNDPEDTPFLIPHSPEEIVDSVLGKHRDEGTDGDAQEPVPENAPHLEVKVVPEVDSFALQDVQHVWIAHFSSRLTRR